MRITVLFGDCSISLISLENWALRMTGTRKFATNLVLTTAPSKKETLISLNVKDLPTFPELVKASV